MHQYLSLRFRGKRAENRCLLLTKHSRWKHQFVQTNPHSAYLSLLFQNKKVILKIPISQIQFPSYLSKVGPGMGFDKIKNYVARSLNFWLQISVTKQVSHDRLATSLHPILICFCVRTSTGCGKAIRIWNWKIKDSQSLIL